MLKLFKWLLRLTVGMILLALLAIILVWYFAIRSVPDYNADFTVSEISDPVEIIRSTENVPHIFSQNDEDAFFALGWVHAQDRLFQLSVLRRAAQGRLSEIYGASAFELDSVARRLELYRNADSSAEVQDDATLAALKAYSAGINQWVMQVNKGARGKGAPEFFLLPDQFAYWTPSDSIAVLKLLASSASNTVESEVLRARLSLAWPEHGTQILPSTNSELAPYASLFPDARLGIPQPRAQRTGEPELRGFMQPGMGFGGNSFAAASERTAANGSLLASDPQTVLTAPSLFYLARLELESGGVIGATIPGIPVVFTGRKPQFAWSMTPTSVDDADIFIEEVKPGDPDSYRSMRGWQKFQTRTEVIQILDGGSQRITLRKTENGPVVPGIAVGLQDVIPAGHVASLRWTGLSSEDTTMSALLGLMRAKTREAAAEAVSTVVAPVLTITLADSRDVQQIRVGEIPERTENHPTGGKMPVPGWLTDAHWSGTAPAAASDTEAETQADMVISTDEVPAGPRFSRLENLLQDRQVHSRDSFITAQLDTVSPAARSLLPLVGANLWFSGDAAAEGTSERQRQDALNLLADWDGDMDEHLPEPLIYAEWMRELQTRLVRDELGPLADDLDNLYPEFIIDVYRNRNESSHWCNVIQTAVDEDCTTIAKQALDRAILNLTDRFGPRVESWRWGDVHRAHHTHPALGNMSGLGWVMNLTQNLSGGSFTVARSGLLGWGTNPNRAVNGAGVRGVYDLADPDSSVFIISTGQSGHPLSRHYDDMAELWRRGEYVGMSLDPDLARAAAVGISHLSPVTQ